MLLQFDLAQRKQPYPMEFGPDRETIDTVDINREIWTNLSEPIPTEIISLKERERGIQATDGRKKKKQSILY